MKYFKKKFLQQRKEVMKLRVEEEERYLNNLFEEQMEVVLDVRNKLHCIELELYKLEDDL